MKGTRYSELQIFAVLRQAEGGVRLFDEDVVWMATAPINRNLISSLGQNRDPTCAHVLAALIRIHDPQLAIFGDGVFQ